MENNWGRVFGISLSQDFIELAAPDERCGVGFVAHLENGYSDGSAGAACQFDEFRERFAFGRANGPGRNPRRPLPGYSYKESAFSRRDGLRGFHRASWQEEASVRVNAK